VIRQAIPVLGLLLAEGSLRLLIAAGPRYIPRLEEVGIDGKVLVFTMGISLLTGLIFGMVPALSALKPDLVADLREGGRGASAGRAHIRFRRLLTIAEVATALVLLIGAGLLMSSLTRLQKVEPGFNAKGVLTMEVVLSPSRYSDDIKRSTFFRELVERAASVPGVQAAGGVTNLPLGGSNMTESYAIEGQPPADVNNLPEAGYRGVTPGYFAAMQIPLLQGRDFSPRDRAESPKVAIVNKTFANRYWPHENPVGRHILLEGKMPYEVIGVIGDIRHAALGVPTVAEIYVCYEQNAFDVMVLVARSRANVAGLGAQVRTQVSSLDSEQPVFNTKTMERVLADSTSEPKFYALLLGAFACLALVLSTLGLYSIISYSVAQRRHEIGVRVALGAKRNDVLTLVVGEGMRLAAIGILAGLILAWLTTHELARLLFAVQPTDPLIFGATAALLAGIAFSASLIPALRASRVSPVVAFRLN
jgi:putative ABC transport system permease protein